MKDCKGEERSEAKQRKSFPIVHFSLKEEEEANKAKASSFRPLFPK